MMPMLPQDEAANLERLEATILPLVDAARGRPVVLADGDRTLSPIDTSRLFLQRAGMDPQPIQDRFKQEGYCFSAFRHHAEAHLRLDALTFERVGEAVAREAPLLGADHAVVVLNHRMSADLLPHLAGHPSLHHIAPGGHTAPGIARLTFETAHRLVRATRSGGTGGTECR